MKKKEKKSTSWMDIALFCNIIKEEKNQIIITFNMYFLFKKIGTTPLLR